MIKIGLVGPCASGKSTLATALRQAGFTCRHIAQEHSYVPDMWQQIANPDILIFLEVSFTQSMQRRWQNWNQADFNEQIFRLRHAHSHADLIVNTDPLLPVQVYQTVIAFLQRYPSARDETASKA